MHAPFPGGQSPPVAALSDQSFEFSGQLLTLLTEQRNFSVTALFLKKSGLLILQKLHDLSEGNSVQTGRQVIEVFSCRRGIQRAKFLQFLQAHREDVIEYVLIHTCQPRIKPCLARQILGSSLYLHLFAPKPARSLLC